ncbi:MAG TPA: hypothetical protein VG733_10360 [Chthoniobacteraceae bacterium]|nr:hypothetical protein [Chthoniobacteraceae bacterium]
MNPPSDTHGDASFPTQPNAGSSVWAAKAALGAAVLLLVALIALPGFLAAEFSRAGRGTLGVDTFGWSPRYMWIGRRGASSGAFRAGGIVLSPAMWLMNQSKPIARFYLWEFHLAGGQELAFGD